MKLLILNGPNLNFLGRRETSIYGNETYQEMVCSIEHYASLRKIEVEILQSNHEGQLIDWIQKAYDEKIDGIIINPAAYTHTSIALRDAIASVAPISVVEVHLSDIYSREDFRKTSYCKEVCLAQISGLGIEGYFQAIELLAKGR